MAVTRRMRTVEAKERWLYRVGGDDYGPVSTEKLLAAMKERKVELTTQVCQLSSGQWMPAGTVAMFRDYYERCKSEWAARELHQKTEDSIKRLEVTRAAGSHFGRLVVIGIIVAGGLSSWLIWRLGQAEAMGLDKLYTASAVTPLPVPYAPEPPRIMPTLATGTRVPVLRELEHYDTAGVMLEGSVATAEVRKLTFDEGGNAVGGTSGISGAALQDVMNASKAGLHACATSAARADRAFKGTRIGYSVASGKITKITVGTEVMGNAPFKACVKAALRRVNVPTFAGPARRVSVPLKVAW